MGYESERFNQLSHRDRSVSDDRQRRSDAWLYALASCGVAIDLDMVCRKSVLFSYEAPSGLGNCGVVCCRPCAMACHRPLLYVINQAVDVGGNLHLLADICISCCMAVVQVFLTRFLTQMSEVVTITQSRCLVFTVTHPVLVFVCVQAHQCSST